MPTTTGDCCNLPGHRLCGWFHTYHSLRRKRAARQFQHLDRRPPHFQPVLDTREVNPKVIEGDAIDGYATLKGQIALAKKPKQKRGVK